MLYFTSDLHLGHANAIKHSNRPFETLEEMDETLIQNINNTVRVNDTLWILGDFTHRVKKPQAIEYRKKINCRYVYLITGNHDKNFTTEDGVFRAVKSYDEIKTDYGPFILFHYPIEHWNKEHYGSIHLHGHIHADQSYNITNRDMAISYPTGKVFSNRKYDVGVDANDYKPVSIEEIAEWFSLERLSYD